MLTPYWIAWGVLFLLCLCYCCLCVVFIVYAVLARSVGLFGFGVILLIALLSGLDLFAATFGFVGSASVAV